MNQLVWFRNNLRVADNTPLHAAQQNGGYVVAVYCFDPRQFGETAFGFPKTGAFRAQFLLESVTDLQQELLKLNIPLLVFTKKPERILPQVVAALNIGHIYSQTEWTHEETQVSEAIRKVLPSTVVWNESYDQFLFHPDDIPYRDVANIPKVFTEFRKKCERHSSVRNTLPKPLQQEQRKGRSFLNSFSTAIPTLADLGLEMPVRDPRTAFPFKGGATAGLERVENYIWNTRHIATYKQTRNGLVGTEYSSKFSAWLANGCLSSRTIYWEIRQFEKEVQKNQDTYWMVFELIWRDFFKYVSLKHGNALFKLGGILKKQYEWGSSAKKLQRWVQGQTTYPFVNANMNEIALTGWMSNRGRQNVASFWAKELQQDWRMGASYFESQLIDYDVHSNWGNWQYVAGVGNDPRNRKFNIEKQADRYDPDGKYVALWSPNE